MAKLEQRLNDDCEATVRMRRAAEAHDPDGVVEICAPDVVLNSPITARVSFLGREEVRGVLGSAFATIEDISYFADFGDHQTRALFFRARVGAQPIEEAMRVELDEAGQIREFTLFYRPLPGLAGFTTAMAPRVARSRHGRIRATIAWVLVYPLGLMTRIGDRLLPWFA